MGGVMVNQGIPGTCEFDFDIMPLSGWGDDDSDQHQNDNDNFDTTLQRRGRREWLQQKIRKVFNRNSHQLLDDPNERNYKTKSISKEQKSTAGWLASYSVFEPHWQITMADARASGYIHWNGTNYQFHNAPFYVEKNWGSTFPTNWYWIQCNAFEGCDDNGRSVDRLTLTAGGGIRLLSLLGMKKSEDVGMVGIHYNGTFYENVPWTGEMEWDIDTWGSWKFNGRCTTGKRLFEVVVKADCDTDDGVMLRVPTKENGLEFRCRDTFRGRVRLSLYELEYSKVARDYVRKTNTVPILENAFSHNCAVEVGGTPWEEKWKAKSNMNKILKRLVKLPYIFN